MTEEVKEAAEQRTIAWLKERKGKVTASRVGDMLATIRNGSWAASRKHYAAQLVAERLSDNPPEPFTNEYIEWGVKQEPNAKLEYTKRTGNVIQEVGFIDHPTIKMCGASPDGLIGEDGLVEFKCPTTATHIETLLSEEVNEKYILQMKCQAICGNRIWGDFVSYDPRLPEDMQMFIKRFEFSPKELKRLEDEIEIFLGEVDALELALTNKFRNE